MFFLGFWSSKLYESLSIWYIPRQVFSTNIWLISRMTMSIVAFNTLKYKGHLQGAAILNKQIMQR